MPAEPPVAKILLVDDDTDMLRAMSRFLTEFGFEVLSTESPFEAGRLAFLHRPDLIVFDVMMPALDGGQAGKFLRKTPEIGQTPIIFYSAMDEPGLREITEGVSNAGYVLKTAGLKALRDAIRKRLDIEQS